MGELADWNDAEAALAAALDNCGATWVRNEGDGAFYGPKIDVTITGITCHFHSVLVCFLF